MSILTTMRYQLDQVAEYKKSILDAIVVISTSDAANESDICNLQEVYYLLEAIEQKALQAA